MTKSRNQEYFVIAATPLPLPGTPAYRAFYSSKGNVVHDMLEAEIFLTREDAKDFAQENEISLGNNSYISPIIFSEQEIKLYWSRRNKNS